VLIDPARLAEADAVLMMMYGSLSALVGAYFGFSGAGKKVRPAKKIIGNKSTGLTLFAASDISCGKFKIKK